MCTWVKKIPIQMCLEANIFGECSISTFLMAALATDTQISSPFSGIRLVSLYNKDILYLSVVLIQIYYPRKPD